MARLDSIGSLHVEHDAAHQQWEWLVSRLLLGVLLVIMAATGLGLFGGGPLSHAREGTAQEKLWIEYERFGRFGAHIRMSLHAPPSPGRQVARITLPHQYLEAMRLITVTPTPESTESTAEGVQFDFAADPSAPLAVYLTLQPIQRWRVRGAVASADTRLEFTQFIYP